MADTRSFEERQDDLIGVSTASRLVGIEQIEAQQRELSRHREAAQLIKYGRELHTKAMAESDWRKRRALYAVAGYPLVETEAEVRIIERTLYKALWPGRSSGIS